MEVLARVFAVLFGLCVSAQAAQAQRMQVDLALILAVDVSNSVNSERWYIQQKGYAQALRSREVIDAMTSGRHGAVAVTFVQWSAPHEQRAISDWAIIRDKESAHMFAMKVELAERFYSRSTAIGNAINFSLKLFHDMPFKASRLIIDISGDGRANDPRDWLESPDQFLERIREEAFALDVTINGLSLKGRDDDKWNVGIKEYYENLVIGGPRAFSMHVEDPDDLAAFTLAIRRKLVQEIAMLR